MNFIDETLSSENDLAKDVELVIINITSIMQKTYIFQVNYHASFLQDKFKTNFQCKNWNVNVYVQLYEQIPLLNKNNH